MGASDWNHWYHMRGTGRIIHIGIWTEECLGVKLSGPAGQVDESADELPVVSCQCAKYPAQQGSGCTSKEIRWKPQKGGRLEHVGTGRCLAFKKPAGKRGGRGSVVALKN